MVWYPLRILAFVALVVLVTGCRLQLQVDVQIDPRAGGSLEVSVTTDQELNQSVVAAGVDPLQRLTERVRALDGSWSVEDREMEDGSRVVTLSTGFADPAEFALRYGELATALDAPEARLLGPLSLSQDPETMIIMLQGELPLQLTELAASDVGTDLDALTERLSTVVSSSLTITTPGRVLDSNGEVTIDGVLPPSPYPDDPATVSFLATPGTTVPVTVVTEPGGADLQPLVLGGVGVLALFVVAGGVFAQRRRDGRRATLVAPDAS